MYRQGVYVEGLSEWVVRSPQEIYGLMERGGTMRATGSTKMNEMSSRSHAVFIIIAEQSETTYLDESGKEMAPEDFHRLVKSRAHGETGQKLLEVSVLHPSAYDCSVYRRGVPTVWCPSWSLQYTSRLFWLPVPVVRSSRVLCWAICACMRSMCATPAFNGLVGSVYP